MADDDEDFSLEDLPGPSGPKAGDPDMNRARDLGYMNVKGGRRDTAPATHAENNRTAQTQNALPPYQVDPESPVAKAWAAFNGSGGYDAAISQFDLFMAGWVARDSQ